MRDSHTVIANVIVLLTRQLFTWSLTAVLIVYLPRYIGDEGLGQISFAGSFTGLFSSLILLGVPTFLVKEVARDRAKLGSYFFNALVMRLPLSALVFVIVFFSVNAMDYAPQTRTVVYFGCLTTIVVALNYTAGSILQAIENMKWLSVAEVVGKAVVTGAGIFVLVNGHGVIAYALVLLLGSGVALAINLSYFVLRARMQMEIDCQVWRTLLIGGFPFLLTTVLATVYSSIDTTILRFMTTDAVVGWYGAALQLFNTFNFLPILVGPAILPALSRMHSSNPEWMVRASTRSMQAMILVLLPMATGAVLVSDKIIGFLHYPEVFNNSIPLLAILSAGLPITGIAMILGTVAAATDQQTQWAKITMVGVALKVILTVLAIPVAQRLYGNGAIGAAVASMTAETMIMILGIRLLPRGVFDLSVLKVFAKSLVGVALMGLAVRSIHNANLLVVIALGVMVYGVFSLVARSVRSEDLALLRDILLRRRLAVES